MATKIKVGDLAKELGVSADDVLEQLHKLYVDAVGEKSKVDDKIAALVRIKLGGSKVLEKPKKEKKTKIVVTLKDKKGGKKKKEKDDVKKEKKTKDKKDVEKKKETSEKKKLEKEESTKKVVETPVSASGVRKLQIVKKAEVAPKKSTEEESKKKTKGKPDIEIVEKGKIPKLAKQKKAERNKKPTIEIVEKVSRPKKHSRYNRKVEVVDLSAKSSPQAAARKTPQKVPIHLPVNVRTLGPIINVKPNMIIQYLMKKGATININQDLGEDVIRDIMKFFGYEMEVPETIESIEKDLFTENQESSKAKSVSRAPIVTFMGHVDHGKTSLLDYIRKTMVTKGEKGGITQHIGAYKVQTAKGAVTFLDTPGHAAFTAMRARGANATDVIVLVVAADDGIMPQTKEAIGHARAAGVSIVVAINKCDLPGANPDKVKQELQAEGFVPEEWGGTTIMVEVSALTGEGVDGLVDMLMLESEMLELKGNPALKARGVVIESKKTPGQGLIVTLLVQNGTLRLNDVVLCGSFYGKVKAMLNDRGERTLEVPPATPVEIMGLQGLPEAGEEFFVVKDEKRAKILSLLKQNQMKKRSMAKDQRATLEDLHARILEGSVKELKIILKADVQGSLEALKHSLQELSDEEVKLDIILDGVGNINESDAMLAAVSNAIIIGFHVKVDSKAEILAKSEKIDIYKYDVIYEATEDVKAAMEGLLEPEERETFQGTAQVREVFSSSKAGKVAGCYMTKGTLHRRDRIRVKRGVEIIFDGEIDSLKRFKDDVKEVKEGFECGLSVKGFNNIIKGDLIDGYIIEKIARRLSK